MRWLFMLAIAAVLAFLGLTVPLGKRTFFEHVRAVWKTEEVQDMKKGIEEKAGPAVQRVKRGVEAGYKEVAREEESARTSAGDAAPQPTTPDRGTNGADAPGNERTVSKETPEATPGVGQPVTTDTLPARKKSTTKKSTKSTGASKAP